MPPSTSVLCTHCNTYISRKQEREHRKFVIAPLAPSPPRLSSRQRRIVDVDSDDDASGAPELSPHELVADACGEHLVMQTGEDDNDVCMNLDDMEPDAGELDLPAQPLDLTATRVVGRVLRERWSRHARVEDDPDDSDSESDSNPELPIPQLEDSDSDSDDSDGIVDWDAIEAGSGLSAWDQLGEGYEREAAAIADRLSEYDRAICRAFSYKVQTHTTDKAFEKLPYVFPSEPSLPKLDSLRSRVAFLAGFKPNFYDCCPNSCCCYVGPHKNLQACPYCNQARFRANGKPRKHFTYIPLIPRLIAFAGNHSVATDMKYRGHIHEHVPGVCSDVFDGSNYRSLRQKYVKLNGKTLEHQFFADSRDVALGLSTDGFAPFKKRKNTAWPLIIFNYNLPPEIRFHIANILALGVIPGPKKPHDTDSFLWPFIQELFQLAIGVRAFDILASKIFALRAFLILVFGDIPAVSMIMRMKGHNGLSPCRMCEITGLRVPQSRATTHYVPLDRSNHPAIQDDTNAVKEYDPNNLPLRDHHTLLAQAEEVQSASTNAEAERLAKKYGIKGVPLLSYLTSLFFPSSFPYDFMHLIWENLIKNLILHWTGEFKGLDDGTESYQLPKAIWEAIGEATAAAGSTIPSAYGSRVPNIATHSSQCSAEMWSFWALYLGPVLLHRRFDRPKYYTHFICLVRLLNICLQFEITDDEIEEIRVGFIEWVKEYEDIYYQHNPDRVSACPVTIHALLHIADSIKATGPVWCYWAFPMERYCGALQPAIRSRRFPYASLDRFVVENGQLTQIKVVYNISEELSLRPPQGQIAGLYADPSYPSCVLLPPKRASRPVPNLEKGIAVALATRFETSLSIIKKHLGSASIDEWGKIRRVDSEAGDTISAASLISSRDDARDTTYVRYELLVDKYARQKRRQPEFKMETYYGQLQHIFCIQFLTACPDLKLEGPTTIILCAIRTCVIDKNWTLPEGLDIHFYAKEGALHYLDAKNVQCLVGRVRDRDRWAVIDRSGSLARAVYLDD